MFFFFQEFTFYWQKCMGNTHQNIHHFCGAPLWGLNVGQDNVYSEFLGNPFVRPIWIDIIFLVILSLFLFNYVCLCVTNNIVFIL